MDVEIASLTYPGFSKKFVDSLKNTGFAVVTGHEIDPRQLSDAYKLWGKFFDQPLKKKMALLYSKETHGGYFPMKSEKAKDAKVGDLKEFYHWYDHLEHGEDDLNCSTWSLRYDLLSLATNLLNKIEDELRLRNVKMNSTEDLSNMIYGSRQTLFRIIHYPPIKDVEVEEGATRAAAHEDINLLTLLPAATNSGLQVKDSMGVWHDIHANPDMIIVNVGDMLQEVTGGYLKSTTHRVVVDVNSTAESRYSMPLFLHPRPEVRLSDRYTAKEYLAERLKQLGLA